MAYTALQLITRAYYLSQVVSRELETPSGAQIEDGLFLLNAVLDFKRTDIRLIPYYTEYFFNSVVDQEMYFVPNLLDVDTFTFNIGDVRYPMQSQTRKGYFAGPRVDNIETLPFSYRVERCLNGLNVYLYFVPADIYQMRIWGKFALTDVTLTTDMSTVYDTYYIEWLRYALAEYICSEYGTTFPDESKMKLAEMTKKLMDVSPKDMSCNKQSYFTNHTGGIDWQAVALYKGWWPS
jgi:hypothetical protein